VKNCSKEVVKERKLKKIDSIEDTLIKMKELNKNSAVKLNILMSDIRDDVKSQPD